MLEVSPVRAFSDNYNGVRPPGDPAGAAVVDPGAARPVEDALDREGCGCAPSSSLTTTRIMSVVSAANPDVEATPRASRELRSRDGPTLPSTIGLERRINPFLLCREPAVKAAAMAHAGRPVSSVEEVFVVFRSWKDGFR
jgi:hypothetical protein